MTMPIQTTTKSDVLSFIKRLSTKHTKNGKPLTDGTMLSGVLNFTTMVFNEYAVIDEQNNWINPFNTIKSARKESKKRDTLSANEILKLFTPGVITDPLDRAICATIFFVGLRRTEVFGLKPADLDWAGGKITVCLRGNDTDTKIRY